MKNIVGVRFRRLGKIYFFNPQYIMLKKDDMVIVDTDEGEEIGKVAIPSRAIDEEKVQKELKRVIRIANERDLKRYQECQRNEKEAFIYCNKKIKEYGLKMNLTDVEFKFNNSKVLFYFTADGRVDFRELVKDLAAMYRTRIELRQIGPRDKAKVIGGIGTCGLPLCCSTLLGEFNGVSINMAKNQMLAINIEKISGACGRLMCCLKYEDEIYSLEKERFPKIGSHVKYQDKDVKVTGLNVINDLVKIETNNGIVFVGLDEIKFDKNNHAGKKNGKPRSH